MIQKKLRPKRTWGISRTVTEGQEQVAARIMKERNVRHTEMSYDEYGDGHLVPKRDRSTNWGSDPDAGANRKKQPWMFGEGLGNCLGLEGPKHSFRAIEPDVDPLTEEEIKVKKAATLAKSRATRARNKASKERIEANEKSGVLLTGCRLFMIRPEHVFPDWDKRASVYGPIPEGVDIAHTEFAELVIIPVIEADEAKKLQLGNGYRDRTGRTFWVTSDMRTKVEKIFGAVVWETPLTKDEAREQFRAQI